MTRCGAACGFAILDSCRMHVTRRKLGRFVRQFAVCLAISFSLIGLLGCKANTKYDGIEAELRTRNRELS